ncbi:MAG: hypothetical protein JRI23_22200 [Deltaproteobacteria bacterium]|jgi:hypothetical protein|nr:hypothetical protein [Deltaproteobacteria bacterium]
MRRRSRERTSCAIAAVAAISSAAGCNAVLGFDDGTLAPKACPGLEGPRGWPSCDNGEDDDCDGFTDDADADCSYVYSVVRASSPPRIDGDCGEYTHAQSVSLRSDASNVLTYWLLWDSTALYVCAAVVDQSLDCANTDPVADRDNPVFADDSLELYFDVDHDAGELLGWGDYKFFVNVANVQTDSDAGDYGWNTDFESAVRREGTLNADGDTDGGFTAELALPWTPWGVTPPTPLSTWGAELMWNDRDDVAGSKRSFEIWSYSADDVNSPDGWGDLLFLE